MPLTQEQIDAIRARHAAATPGPWHWTGYIHSHQVHLSGRCMGSVLEFRRWGMQSAQPTFCTDGLLCTVPEVAAPDTSPERGRITRLNHPDAEAIAHSWQDVADLLAEVDRLRTLVPEPRRSEEG